MTPFKEEINPALVERLGSAIGTPLKVNDLDLLELKERVIAVSEALFSVLGDDWRSQLVEVFGGSDFGGIGGLQGWPILRVIEDHGLDDPEASLEAIRRLTHVFSGEFAVRTYLCAEPDRSLSIIKGWTTSESEHVRRLASEGTRPRLPWGQRIPAFVQDPSALFPLLEPLLDDESEYVRRSVANHLNDIAKDHPDRLVEVVSAWARPSRMRLVKHALRSLVKAGHPGALEVVGVLPFAGSLLRFECAKACVVGETIDFAIELEAEQKLVIDYALHFQGARGPGRRKVFKWTTRETRGRLELARSHRMREVSVRKLYPGAHAVELLINGRSMGTRSFLLRR